MNNALADANVSWRPVDYILFIQAEVDVRGNPNEVQDARFVTPDELRVMLRDDRLQFTPWFKLMCESLLFEWWEHLEHKLDGYVGEREIRRM